MFLLNWFGGNSGASGKKGKKKKKQNVVQNLKQQ